MGFLTVEINSTGNQPVEPTEIIGLSLENIYTIEKVRDLDIYFGGNQYIKTFFTKNERDKYFDYIGSKLEAIDISPNNFQSTQG